MLSDYDEYTTSGSVIMLSDYGEYTTSGLVTILSDYGEYKTSGCDYAPPIITSPSKNNC